MPRRLHRLVCGLATAALLPLAAGAPARAPQAPPAFVPDDAGYRKIARPFLDRHCVPCHAGPGAKGAFRADRSLGADLTDRAVLARWAAAVEQLNAHRMPPRDHPQPSPAEVAAVVDWAVGQSVRARQARHDPAAVLRRLTRDEYRGALADLTGVEVDVAAFPADPPAGGFDNNARALTVSPLHVELYAAAARQALDQALVPDGAPPPPRIRWRFDPKVAPMDSRRVRLDDANPHAIVNGNNNRQEGEWVAIHHDAWDTSVDARDFAVPVAGEYVVRLRAAGRVPDRAAVVASAERILAQRRDQQTRENPAGARWHREQYENDLRHFQNDPIYAYGPARVRLVQHLGPTPRTVAEFDVPAAPDAPQVFETRVRFTTERAGLNFHYAYSLPSVLENFWMQRSPAFARPELLVRDFEIEGPLVDAWPPASHRRILFDSPLRRTDERAYARAVLARFLRRAYRRPVAPAEVDAKLALYDAARRTRPFVDAVKIPLTAALASPHFLFLVEPPGPRPLGPHERAARLAFFLTAAPPDDALSALADSSRLSDPAVVRAQTRRLLADPRSDAFVRRFVGQWLGLGQVGANPPAPDLYPGYDRHYETSIVAESQAFFAHVLRHDLDARNLIRSDFAVVNERLARAYGIPGVKGDHFRAVPVPPGVRRGGIPTQASVLTITSNGTRTSPVKRGAWILKTLLGDDPGLPVADAGEIAARVPGIEKATVRRRLEVHRSRAQCARCHDRIDPIGFALENFDAAGLWREREGFGYQGRVEAGDPPVDASARLPDGTRIVGVEGLQTALLAREDDFLRCLSAKMCAFALGREIGLADRPTIEAAVAHMKKNGRTLRSLVEFVTTSEAFLHR